MINYISKPFRWFFKLEAASGLVLLFAAIIALFISNSGLSDFYFATLNKYLFIGINNFGLKLSVLHWINDALMAIFFFFVTLEIKREFLQGELSNIKQALLPIIAAVGGMLVPALFYVFINLGDSETLNGWAIPSATDIAFSLGVLSLLGKRVPLSLKVFLTALAIIDDLGAIVIIALFYSGDLSIKYLSLMLLAFIILLVIGFISSFQQICLAYSLKLAPASMLAPLRYISVPIGILSGVYFFNEQLSSTFFIGTSIIIISSLIIIKRESMIKVKNLKV